MNIKKSLGSFISRLEYPNSFYSTDIVLNFSHFSTTVLNCILPLNTLQSYCPSQIWSHKRVCLEFITSNLVSQTCPPQVYYDYIHPKTSGRLKIVSRIWSPPHFSTNVLNCTINHMCRLHSFNPIQVGTGPIGPTLWFYLISE